MVQRSGSKRLLLLAVCMVVAMVWTYKRTSAPLLLPFNQPVPVAAAIPFHQTKAATNTAATKPSTNAESNGNAKAAAKVNRKAGHLEATLGNRSALSEIELPRQFQPDFCVITIGHCLDNLMAVGLGTILWSTLESIAECQSTYPLAQISIQWNSLYSTYCPRNEGSKLSVNARIKSQNCWHTYFDTHFTVEPPPDAEPSSTVCLDIYQDIPGGYRCLVIPDFGSENDWRSRCTGSENDCAAVRAAAATQTAAARHFGFGLTQKYMQMKSEIIEQVDSLMRTRGITPEVTLVGVHLRGTDHAVELPESRLLSLESYIRKAERLLESIPGRSILVLAADNREALQVFKDHFGANRVLFAKAAARADAYEPIKYNTSRITSEMTPDDIEQTVQHFQNTVTGLTAHYDMTSSHIEKGHGVLVDIALLARCHHFIHYHSSVANMVLLYNPEVVSHTMAVADDPLPKLKSPAARKLTTLVRNRCAAENPTNICPIVNGWTLEFPEYGATQ